MQHCTTLAALYCSLACLSKTPIAAVQRMHGLHIPQLVPAAARLNDAHVVLRLPDSFDCPIQPTAYAHAWHILPEDLELLYICSLYTAICMLELATAGEPEILHDSIWDQV